MVEEEKEDQTEEDQTKKAKREGQPDKEKQTEEERGKAESPPPWFGFRSVPFVSSG